jgi:uncharacterized protein (TIGR00297 family)
MSVIERTILGVLLAALLSVVAFRARALTSNGAVTAVIIGAIVLGLGGWTPAVLLVLFFLSSNLFTRLSKISRPETQGHFAKGGRRDARQVLANGSIAAIFSLLMLVNPEGDWLLGVVGALAAAAADTWATEWGVVATRQPRRITDWKQVPVGTSGGITLLGTFGSLVGALSIGATASLMERSPQFIFVALLSGVLGSAFDSLLGSTLQVQYQCPSCGKQTEQHPIHVICGTETGYFSGISWLDNDFVNLLANLSGALLALLWKL